MIKFNKEQLVMQSVQGKVHPPVMKRQYRVGSDGRPWILPATGGITYNFQIGDGCMGWPAIMSNQASVRRIRIRPWIWRTTP